MVFIMILIQSKNYIKEKMLNEVSSNFDPYIISNFIDNSGWQAEIWENIYIDMWVEIFKPDLTLKQE